MSKFCLVEADIFVLFLSVALGSAPNFAATEACEMPSVVRVELLPPSGVFIRDFLDGPPLVSSRDFFDRR